jgi:FKBP-type peptidyl-prolyl cis-trans isomerase FkpA
MKRYATLVLVLGGLGCLAACKPPQATEASPSPGASGLASDQEKTVYAMGVMLGRNLVPLSLTPAEIEIVTQGVSDAAAGKPPQVDLQTYGSKVQEFAQARATDRAKAEKDKSVSFAETAAKEAGAVKTPSGLVYRTVTPGQGASPGPADTVKVHYAGTLIDGTEFDSSRKRGEPVEFRLDQVIPCWTEAVQRMKVGEKARIVCPSDIAYGDQGRPPQIPGGATLVFEVELLDVKK